MEKRKKHPPPGPTLKEKAEKWLFPRRRWVLGLIIILSFLVRVIYFFQLDSTHLINQHRYSESDMAFFDRWAVRVSQGDWLTDTVLHPEHLWMKDVSDSYFRNHPGDLERYRASAGADSARLNPSYLLWSEWYGGKIFHQEPLYPYFIAAVYSVMGRDVRWVFAIQMLFGILVNVLIYLVTRRYFGILSASIAGFLAVFTGPLLFYELVLLRSAPGVFFSIFLVWMTGLAVERKKVAFWLLTGISGGFAILMNSFFILFLAGTAVALLILCFREKRFLAGSLPALAGGVILVLLPVFIRNSIVGVHWTALASNSTFTFITMNQPGTTVYTGWSFPTDLVGEVMAASNGKLLGSIGPILNSFHSMPAYIGFLWGKFHGIFSGYEIPNNVNFYFYREYAGILYVTFIGFIVIAPLALTGIFISLFRKKWSAWPLYIMILVLLAIMTAFWPFGRFRVLLIPVVVPFAGFAISSFLDKRKNLKRILVVAGMVFFFWFAYSAGAEGISRITSREYAIIYNMHYLDGLTKDVEKKDYTEVSLKIKDFLDRYEPDKVRNTLPGYRCRDDNESGIMEFFAKIHTIRANMMFASGDTSGALGEKQIADRLNGTLLK